MKIASVVIGIIGAIAVCGLDSDSPVPLIIVLICLAFEVVAVCANWDAWMRRWIEVQDKIGERID